MRVLIGCPVVAREWIIRPYLEYASRSAERAGVDVSFLMVGGLGDPTFEVVDSLAQFAPDVARIYVDEPRTADVRDWPKAGRKERMVDLRNIMLSYVRAAEGVDFFLSCDSDILLHENTIGNLIETQLERKWAAVGGYAYMSHNRSSSSYGNLFGVNVLRRPDIAGEVQRCDVVMAIVLMSEPAWHVDYEYHYKGEDIGWSKAVKRQRMILGVDARQPNKHVMSPDALSRVDPRVGY